MRGSPRRALLVVNVWMQMSVDAPGVTGAEKRRANVSAALRGSQPALSITEPAEKAGFPRRGN
jgi:hypothetical protein